MLKQGIPVYDHYKIKKIEIIIMRHKKTCKVCINKIPH